MLFQINDVELYFYLNGLRLGGALYIFLTIGSLQSILIILLSLWMLTYDLSVGSRFECYVFLSEGR